MSGPTGSVTSSRIGEVQVGSSEWYALTGRTPPQPGPLPGLPRFAGNLSREQQEAISRQQQELESSSTWRLIDPRTWPAHKRAEVAAANAPAPVPAVTPSSGGTLRLGHPVLNLGGSPGAGGYTLSPAQFGHPDFVPSDRPPVVTRTTGPADPDPGRPPAGPSDPAAAAAAATAAANASWQSMLEAQRVEAERLRQQLEREYRSRKADLRAQFEFAETEQERAQLAFLMNSLDEALTAGQGAISAGYQAATGQVRQLAAQQQEAAQLETAAVQGLFGQAQKRLGGRVEELAQQVGPGAGLMGDALSGSQDFYNLLATDAAREAALGERLSGVVARDISAGEQRMALQEAAQQADLTRSGMQTRASLTAQQQAQVAQRIAEDRRTFVNALQRLQSDISSRGGQIDMSQLGTYTDQARLAAAEADTARRLAAEAQQQQAMFAFSREQDTREQERRIARGETPEFEREMLEFARNTSIWNTLPDEIKSPELWAEIFGMPLRTR